MKATTIIIAIALTLQISNVFAINDETVNAPNTISTSNTTITLAPTTPSEAEFTEITFETASHILTLAPVPPTTADFNEPTPEINTPNLKPTTPSTADFEETNPLAVQTINLAPSTPASADFE